MDVVCFGADGKEKWRTVYVGNPEEPVVLYALQKPCLGDRETEFASKEQV